MNLISGLIQLLWVQGFMYKQEEVECTELPYSTALEVNKYPKSFECPRTTESLETSEKTIAEQCPRRMTAQSAQHRIQDCIA